ncbi:protein SGT1 homolog [Halyomorpha halys]|uniref:protein SGT1 homolog n=1 Tax=Halyomorpha halys TaxID=286706 RepID=UPI0006D4FA91|nr:protein SGT1 homolog [Halyomorpha halys]
MSSSASCDSASTAEQSEAKASTSSSLKLDWYQTETQVVLNVLAKNVDQDKLKVNFSDSEIDLYITFKDGTEQEKTIYLLQDIIPDQCKYKVMSTKIEMRLPKKSGLHWSSLEKTEKPLPKKTERNWDKFVSQLEDDKMEGEAVLNALFQKIYNEGTDEVKKAMNKSFLESGGTELNTNWDAVSKGRVTIKPPEGMEWRTWDK